MTRRPIALAAISFAAAVALAGCSSSSPTPEAVPSSSSPTPSEQPTVTVDPLAWGTEWTRVDSGGPNIGDAQYTESFYGAGEYWVIDTALPHLWHHTSDGVTWATLDLSDHGLPQDAMFVTGNFECVEDAVATDRGSRLDVIAYTYTNSSHPAGLQNAPWLISVGDEVNVTSGAAIGLETMPGPIDSYSFATICASGFTDFNGSHHMVGSGRWSTPNSTSAWDAFVATASADGTWTVASSRGAFLGGDEMVRPGPAGVINGSLTVFSYAMDAEMRDLHVWSSPDGAAWDLSVATGREDTYTSLEYLTSGDAHVVIASAYFGSAGAWTSSDGVTWNYTNFAADADYVGAVAGPYGLDVFLRADGGEVAWRLDADGGWSSREVTGIPRSHAKPAVLPNGTLIGFADNTVYVAASPE